MNEYETLLLAAKAVGLDYDVERSKPVDGRKWFGLWCYSDEEHFNSGYWNPLTNSDDALSVQSKLKISVTYRTNENGDFVLADSHQHLFYVENVDDNAEEYEKKALIRKVITNFAASLGKKMLTHENDYSAYTAIS